MAAKGQNNEDILSGNRALIVQYLQHNKICTRSQLSKALGLTPASITKTVAGLIENGLIEETGFLQGEKGRRSIGITLKTDLFKVIGVKLSRRNYSIGVFDFDGESYGTRTESFGENTELGSVLGDIKHGIRDYISRYDNVVAIGVAVPGPYLERESRIVLVTDTKGWKEIDLREYFAEEFSAPVIIRHDANSGALAEWWFGSQAVHNGETAVHFLIGEGVGAGVIVGGEVLGGDNGTAAEIGHISVDANGPRCACGNYGCLELYCSSINFAKHAKSKLGEHPDSLLNRCSPLTFQSVFDAARDGDPLAVSLVKRAGRYIGYGTVTLINAYNPSTILISNDMAAGGELLLSEIMSVVRERVLEHILKDVSIELSRLPGDPILCGAAAVAIDFCLQNPEHLLVR